MYLCQHTKTQTQKQVLKKKYLHVSVPAHTKNTNTKTGFEEKQLTCICAGTQNTNTNTGFEEKKPTCISAGTQTHKHKNRF